MSDSNKIDATAEFIRRRVQKRGRDKLAMALEVGGHIFDQYFGGDPHLFTYKGKKSVSMLALLDHPKIVTVGLRHRTLAYYVEVAIQDQQFDALIKAEKLSASVRSLGYTKRVRLLPTGRTSDLIRIATTAAEQKLDKDQITDLVKEANARPGTVSRPLSEVTKLIKETLDAVEALCGIDASVVADEDLHLVSAVVPRVNDVLTQLADVVEAEAGGRPGATPAQTLMQDFAANTPEELDELLASVVSGEVEFGSDIRADSLNIVTHLGEKMLAHLNNVDQQAAQDWVLEFVTTLADKLDAGGRLAAKLKPRKKGRGAAAQGGTTWFKVCSHDKVPDVLFNLDTFVSGIFNPCDSYKCVVKANSPEDAIQRFAELARGVDPDVGDPTRVFEATKLRESLGRKMSNEKYLALPPSQRLPTVDEYVAEKSLGLKQGA